MSDNDLFNELRGAGEVDSHGSFSLDPALLRRTSPLPFAPFHDKLRRGGLDRKLIFKENVAADHLYLLMQKNRFAFLVHPLGMPDVVAFEPKAANKRLPLVEKILDWMPPFVGSHIEGVRSTQEIEAEGWFITIPLLPQQFVNMPREKVMEKIIAGAKLGQAQGAQVVGLGAYTSVVGDAGITVARHLDIPVTSGNSYTIATAIEGAVAAARSMGIPLESARAAVV
ncbi:MAG: hypothetical protein ACYCW6_21975, partial [Candidatus Xenobia bacterium]